jgi:hypothetical protein
MSTAESSKEPLASIWVGLAIWLFFPLGLFLLWRHPTLGKNGKWWAAGIAWACFVMFIGSRAETEGPAETDSTSAEQSEAITPSGKNFSDKQMDVLYEKAAQVQLGMSAKDVFRVMGQPPTKQWNYDPHKDVPANLRHLIVDPRVVVGYSWCSAKDPENALVSVYLKEGEADWISAHRGRGKTVLDKQR